MVKRLIKIDEITCRKLKILKHILGVKTYDDVINKLIEMSDVDKKIKEIIDKLFK